MKKFLIRYHLAIVAYTIVVVLFVRIMLIQNSIYRKYQGMKGTVVCVSKAEHTGRYFPTIRLEDGTVQTVNNGHIPVNVGDSWYNNLGYHPLFGISGQAYGIYPGDSDGFAFAGHVILLLLAYTPPAVFLVWVLYAALRKWMQIVGAVNV